jgi:hypothetical protein
MDSSKAYKQISTGKYLGRFIVAWEYHPEGMGRGRDGSTYYFMPDGSTKWQARTGIMISVPGNCNLSTRIPIPDDIVETNFDEA